MVGARDLATLALVGRAAAAWRPASFEGVDLIPVLGQSGAVGAGDQDHQRTYRQRAHPRVRQFANASAGPFVRRVLPAVDPLFHVGRGGRHQVGFATTFGARWADRNPTRGVLLVPCGMHSTGFDPNDWVGDGIARTWDPDDQAADVNLYDLAVEHIHRALDQADRIPVVLWHQGENDLHLSTDEYADRLTCLIGRLRIDIPEASDAPFLIGQMVPAGIAAHEGRAAIDKAQRIVAETVDNVVFVPGPTGPDVFNVSDLAIGDKIPTHYNARGQRDLAAAFSAAIAR